MNDLSRVRYILTFALTLMAGTTIFAQSQNTNSTIFGELAWAETYNHEVDLIHSLLNQTNRNFDQKVCSSLTTNADGPVVISYRLVSFTFYYPAGIAIPPSSTEMANPDELVCKKDDIIRRATTNEIPANYVRLFDSRRKNAESELDLLLGIAPLERPQEVRYSRRSFRFVYQKGWKEL